MSEVKRWSAKRKQEVVLRLLRGESLDALSRETGVPAGDLSSWRDEFLEAGQAGLKRRSEDPKADALERVELQEFTRDRVVFDTGAARGENTVSVPLTVGSADAPDGSEVEVRFVRADTGQEVHPWRTIGVLSDGALTGRYVQPSDARSVHWLRPQARVKGSAAVDEASNTCGFGHVWNMWGQSNWAQLWGNYNSNLAGLFEPQVTNPGDVQCLEYARVRNAISRGNLVPDPFGWSQGDPLEGAR